MLLTWEVVSPFSQTSVSHSIPNIVKGLERHAERIYEICLCFLRNLVSQLRLICCPSLVKTLTLLALKTV